MSSKSNGYGSTSDDWRMLIEQKQANNGPEADKWPSLPFPLFPFTTNTSDQRLVDKWLFLREWVLWPWKKGERSVSIHPQPVSALLHSNLQKFLPTGNSSASTFSSSPPVKKEKLDYPLCCDLLPPTLEVCSRVTFVCLSRIPPSLFSFFAGS